MSHDQFCDLSLEIDSLIDRLDAELMNSGFEGLEPYFDSWRGVTMKTAKKLIMDEGKRRGYVIVSE